MPNESKYDLDFRPESYWGPAEPGPGTERPRKLLAGAIPFGSGQDFLPDFDDNEVEIASISLRSTMGDYIEVRARRTEDRIIYRIVDEYADEYDPSDRYTPGIAESTQPLTMGEMIELLEDTKISDDGDRVLHGLFQTARGGAGTDLRSRAEREQVRSFVSISSEFYPQLSEYYEQEMQEWIEAGEEYPPK